MVVLYVVVITTPTLKQVTLLSNSNEMFLYLNPDEDIPPVEVSKDSTYYELRTDYGHISLTDVGTKSQIDKLNSPKALFFTDHICNTNGIIHKDEIPRLAGDQLLFLFQNAVIPARVCVHANILENEKFDEEITVIEDKLLWTRIASHFPIIQINKETVVYTLHEDNSINLKNNPSLKCWDGLKIFFKRYPEINRRIPKRIKRNIISDTLFGVAKCYIFSNRKSKAIYFILYSIIKPFHFQTKHKIYQIGAVLGIFKQHQYIKE